MKWNAKIISHKGTPRIAIFFEKDATLISRIKTFEDALWSASERYWHLPDTDKN
jgi:integrase/recombinase XerD